MKGWQYGEYAVSIYMITQLASVTEHGVMSLTSMS